MTTSIPEKRQVNPGMAEVDSVLTQLRSNADFVLQVIVSNNGSAVADRYEAITGKPAPTTVEGMVRTLKSMRSAGQKATVANITLVPWMPTVHGNSAIEQAVRAFKGEAAAMVSPTNPYVFEKNLPTTGSPDDENYGMEGGTATTGGNGDGGSAGGVGWVNDTVNILDSLGGVLGILTGNNGTPAANTNTPQPATNWLKVVLVTVGIVAAVVAVVLIIKAMKK